MMEFGYSLFSVTFCKPRSEKRNIENAVTLIVVADAATSLGIRVDQKS